MANKARTHKFRESMKAEWLALMAKGYGILAISRKVGVSRTTYYNWCKSDPQFKADSRRILDDPIHQARILKKSGRADMSVDMKWQNRFVAMYRRTGDKVEAANACSKSTTEIASALDPKSESYDEEFHLAFLEEEQRRLWTIEDNTLKKAEHDAPTARFVLRNLLKDKYGKSSEGSVILNTHWHTQKGEDQAGEFIDGLFGPEAHTERTDKRPMDQVDPGSGTLPSSTTEH